MPFKHRQPQNLRSGMRAAADRGGGRSCDRLLTQQPPPTRSTTYATQMLKLRQAGAESAGRSCWSGWPTAWFNRFVRALRYLDARGWHPFAPKGADAATDADTQPELL